MALPWMAVGLLLTSLGAVARAETVAWQIATATTRSGQRQVLANGVKQYSPAADVWVQEHLRRRDGATMWSKSLLLSDGFAVSARVRRERRLRGFGLVIHRRGDRNAYGYNWFARDTDAEFLGRRGVGRVAVAIRREPGFEELEAVEFLEDVTLRYLDDVRRPPGAYSHEVVIRRGSVLDLTAGPMCAASDARRGMAPRF